ncbi:MAG TPA: aminotransferase class V-fold PLP-dependent enzyme [Acidimicrobiales bacterium]|nr:aminotransferase class V-fold PLP-dependent enzyme [Acidimicrobiales bacterium]
MKSSDLDFVVEALEAELRPYRETHHTYTRLPATGRDRDEILAEMRALAAGEQDKWKSGFASGAVYHGGAEHIDFLNDVYAVTSQANPLHPELWPSAVKYEAEIVAMTASMLGGGESGDQGVCGTVSSGGTESILLAMRTYRDRARAERGITDPEIVVPVSAHAAFDKAAHYFGIRLVPVPLGPDWKADVAAAARLITDKTVAVVASAPGFPHGIIDPVEELADLALRRGVGCHVDCCLGGFVLPWAERMGYPVPPFDFRLPGVTSMSADTHKFGYAAKGTSVVLYRTNELRRYQYYRTATWMGGLYYSPTFAGSRPGALTAEAWAAMLAFGEEGYMVATKAVLDTAATIRRGIEAIPEIFVLGDPLWVIAFASDQVDVYAVMDQMSGKGWSLNGLQSPPAAHICVTLRHAQPGVADRFVADLGASVQAVRSLPGAHGVMAPIYGMTGTVKTRGTVEELLARYGDLQFKA